MSQRYVYIVDDDAPSRASLRAIVESMDAVIFEFDSAEALLRSELRRPACLITDQRMPGMSGIQLIEQLRSQNIQLSIIVLTAFPDTRSTVRAMQSRAQTLLEKPCNPQELWDAIQLGLTQDEENYQREKRIDAAVSRLEKLNSGEMEVLELLMEGLANKVIANRLGIGLRTVEGRRASLLEKLDVQSIPELTLIWVTAGKRLRK